MVKFPLGRIQLSPGVRDEVRRDEVQAFVERHARGDWGNDQAPEDILDNDRALGNGGIIFSQYRTRYPQLLRVIIRTDQKQAMTQVSLMNEYTRRWRIT